MKTKIEWEEDIIALSTKIISEYPELTKYINEIPVVETGKEGVNLKNLEGYYQSLQGILKKYGNTHQKE